MHVSRGVFDVEATVRKLSSRIRPTPKVSRFEWSVVSAVQPLYSLIRLIGLAPFGFSKGHFKSTRYDVIYSLLCSAVNTYLAYVVLRRFAGIKRGSSVLDFTENTKVVLNSCIVLINALLAIWTRKELITVLNTVKHFDLRICDIGYPRTERTTKIWVWSTCVCFVFIWVSVSRTGMIAFEEPWTQNTMYLISYCMASGSVIKFSSLVLLLGQRFRHLNRIAQRSKESATTKYTVIDLRVVQQLHNTLMTAGESLSSQFSWLLLLWLANLSAHSVTNLYFLITWVLETPNWANSRLALGHCIVWWIIAFVSQLLLLHIACHFTSAEANTMGLIVTDYLWLPKTLSSRRNYRVESSLHFVNRKLNFSAAGCFDVNLPLLRSIAALFTVYLVLLLQSEDTNK